jgi:hypothetical protein
VLRHPEPPEAPPLDVASQVDAPAQRLADRLPGRYRAQVKHRQGNGQALCHDRKTARPSTRQQPRALGA